MFSLDGVLLKPAEPLREARPPKPGGFFFASKIRFPRSLYLPRVQLIKKLTSAIFAAHNQFMMQFLPLLALSGAVLIALGLSLYACRRVAINEKALVELDWETLANLTGEVGSIKRSLQKTNSRISGMSSGDPMQSIQELQKLQIVTNEPAQLKRGG